MIDKQISNNADQLICLLYKSYLEKRYLDINESDAKCFGNHEIIHEKYVPNWDMVDVIKTLNELKINAYIDAHSYDGNTISFNLNDNAIIYIESKLKSGLTEIADFLFKTT